MFLMFAWASREIRPGFLDKKKGTQKRPHHLTFRLETSVFTMLFAREVFGEQVTQHLTYHLLHFIVSSFGLFMNPLFMEI